MPSAIQQPFGPQPSDDFSTFSAIFSLVWPRFQLLRSLHRDFKVCESLPAVTRAKTPVEFLDEVGGWSHRRGAKSIYVYIIIYMYMLYKWNIQYIYI